MGSGFYPFCGIPAGAVDRMNEQLERLVESGLADCAMVVDHSGYLIARRGTVEYLPLEDLATITAGSFASFTLTMKISEMSADFFSRSVCSQYCLNINSQLFLLALHPHGPTPDRLRAEARTAAEAIRNDLGQDEPLGLRLESVQFITDKLDELFKDS